MSAEVSIGNVVLAEISATALDIGACLAAVSGPDVGGLGLFVGTVRDADHDRAVLSLSYEAHPSAQARLAELCAEAASRGVRAVAAVHRVGELAIGDAAVVVAVSAVHRAEALETTRWLIDAIKGQVPIWKHQHFADGTDEWVGACE
jgi:molybdopterin synthase catalytic subunit